MRVTKLQYTRHHIRHRGLIRSIQQLTCSCSWYYCPGRPLTAVQCHFKQWETEHIAPTDPLYSTAHQYVNAITWQVTVYCLLRFDNVWVCQAVTEGRACVGMSRAHVPAHCWASRERTVTWSDRLPSRFWRHVLYNGVRSLSTQL